MLEVFVGFWDLSLFSRTVTESFSVLYVSWCGPGVVSDNFSGRVLQHVLVMTGFLKAHCHPSFLLCSPVVRHPLGQQEMWGGNIVSPAESHISHLKAGTLGACCYMVSTNAS